MKDNKWNDTQLTLKYNYDELTQLIDIKYGI